MMWTNYLKIALRNSLKQKLLSFINIFSLAFGIAACMLIFLFIRDERAFDAFHEKKDQIYRLDEVQSFPGTNTQNVALSMPGMGPALIRDYPEVLNYTRYQGRGKRVYELGDLRLLVENTAMVDSTFLDVFDFELVEGDQSTCLDAPMAIVLSESVAQMFFPDGEAIGQSLRRGEYEYNITGIMRDVPEHSHLQFDMLMSMNTVISDQPNFNSQFGSNFLNTYIVFDPSVDIAAFESKMPEFLTRCMPPDTRNGDDINDFYKLFYQPLQEVHLASMDIEHDYNNYRKFNGEFLGIFTLVGIFILLIAALNFMNLITARASHRGKEVGVRKSIGALKGQLLSQFVTESALLSVFAFVAGVTIAAVSAPVLSGLVDRDLSVSWFFTNPLMLLGAFALSVLLGILAGIYPSLYMSSFNPVNAIKGNVAQGHRSLFRSSLVVLQFGLAIAMIISTLIVVQQLFFMQNKDIGFNKDHILLVDMNGEANENFNTIKTELGKSSNILGVTASGQRLGNNFHQWGFKLRTDTIVGMTPSNVNVDFDYPVVYGMDIISGRTFDKDRPRDDGFAYIVNESFAREMGLQDPVGAAAGHSWYDDDSLGTIIGVARDFNFNSLHYDINTLVMSVHPDWGYDELSVKINGKNVEAAIADVQRTWDQFVPSWPFEYSFLDEHFEELYRSEQQMQSVVSAMALLAILIACMGLFGLAAITTEKRTKEIGIRKVLGASVAQIMTTLSKRFALLVVVAFVIFSPVTWFMMRGWLQNYAEQVSISPVVFVIGFVLAFVIAILTISYHTLRSASANPIEALRDE